MGDGFPASIPIYDEHGLVFEQEVLYEWRPPKCSHCEVFGHSHNNCAAGRRLPTRKFWRPKSATGGHAQSSDASQPEEVAPQVGAAEDVSPTENVATHGTASVDKHGSNLNFQSKASIPIKNAFDLLNVDELDSMGEGSGDILVSNLEGVRSYPSVDMEDPLTTAVPNALEVNGHEDSLPNLVDSGSCDVQPDSMGIHLNNSAIGDQLEVDLNEGVHALPSVQRDEESIRQVSQRASTTSFLESNFIAKNLELLDGVNAGLLMESIEEDLEEIQNFEEINGDVISGLAEGITTRCVGTSQSRDEIEGRYLTNMPTSQIGKKRKTKKKKKKHENDSIKDSIAAGLNKIIRVDGESGGQDDGYGINPSSEEEGVVSVTKATKILLQRLYYIEASIFDDLLVVS